jgi:preprotein translocase subunit YajC
MKLVSKIAKVVSAGASLTTLYTSTAMSVAFAEAATTAGSAANTAAGAETGFGMQKGLLFGAFILIFYFFIIRPQSKRAKEQRDLVGGLQKGDEVLTNAGIVGKITKVSDNFFVVMIAEGTEVLMQKQAIAGSLPKGTMKSV